MVARPGAYQSYFTAGELAPETHGQFGLKSFYSAAGELTNVEPVAQGGFRLMARSRKLGRIRRQLSDLATSQETDSSGAFAGPGTVFEIRFAAAQPVSVVAVSGFSSDHTDDLEDALQIEWDNGSSWSAFGPAMRLTPSARNQMRALEPGAPVSAVGIRVRLATTPPASIDITVTSLTARSEGAEYTSERTRPFTFDDNETYTYVLSERHVDIYKDGVLTGAAETEFLAAEVDNVIAEQRFDTLLLFHPARRSRRILRDGSDAEWPWDDVPFTDVPQVDLGGAYVNITDIWSVYVQHPTGGRYGRVVTVTIDGEETEGVTVVDTGGDDDADIDAFCASLAVAIEALPSVAAGIACTRDAVTATFFRFVIQFTGTGNEGGGRSLAAAVVSHADSAATVAHSQIGELGGEDLISDTRGWAACARFYQDRLWTGGFAAKKGALLASATGDYFNLNIEIASDTGAILANLDTEGAERLQRIERSRHLVLFTSDAEYFVSDRTIGRNTPLNIVEASRNGSAPQVPVVSSEGELYYISKNRSVAYAALYSDISQAYDSQPMSLLASHLVDGIVDAALQRPETESDAARYFLPREDGAMAVGILIRNQDVTGFVRWTTDGAVKSVCVDGANVPYLIVERQVDGEGVRFYERLEQNLLVDCATDIVNAPAATTVAGLGDYEGAEVWAIADGVPLGPFTVTGEQITLQDPAANVTVGRWTPPRMMPLPIPRLVAERTVLARPIRVHTVKADVIATTSIAIAGNGGPVNDVPLYFAGLSDQDIVEPFTGELSVGGLSGYTATGEVLVTQVRPGTLQVRDMTREAKL